jgi:Na+-transporting methylmalonyl-CoA/oxaloacetate decarboxylase beta subunit
MSSFQSFQALWSSTGPDLSRHRQEVRAAAAGPDRLRCLLEQHPGGRHRRAGRHDRHDLHAVGVETGIFPLLIFMGVGALTDFGALIANPIDAAARRRGAVRHLRDPDRRDGAELLPGFDFTLQDASAIAIIGGADGPTAIFLASQLAPDLLGAIAVAAYSYMALVPIIQPPIMRALTTPEERVVMQQLRPVSQLERILFPFVVLCCVPCCCRRRRR